MSISQKIKERSKLYWFTFFKKRNLIEELSSKPRRNDKISVFFTMDLEYRSIYPKKASYEGFKNYQEILQKNNITSTFFVCGDFALDNKKEIIDLSDGGNEIGSHGYGHINLGPDIWWDKKFKPSNNVETRKKSIKKNHEILIKILKKHPISFRAPYLSIDNTTLNILSKIGYKIDSSVNNSLFGMPTIPYNPSEDDILKKGDSDIIEFFITCSISRTLSLKPSNLDFKRINFFNPDDLSKNIRIINETKDFSPYVVVLTHPYEFSDSFKQNSDERLDLLSKFISILKKDFDANFLKFEDIRGLNHGN
jgi:peptidoglycan/xylan/chitin deacetylase (PgdA/CDA1 family)